MHAVEGRGTLLAWGPRSPSCDQARRCASVMKSPSAAVTANSERGIANSSELTRVAHADRVSNRRLSIRQKSALTCNLKSRPGDGGGAGGTVVRCGSRRHRPAQNGCSNADGIYEASSLEPMAGTGSLHSAIQEQKWLALVERRFDENAVSACRGMTGQAAAERF